MLGALAWRRLAESRGLGGQVEGRRPGCIFLYLAVAGRAKPLGQLAGPEEGFSLNDWDGSARDEHWRAASQLQR